jgi:transposase
MGGDEHRCEYRDRVEVLEAELRDVREKFAAMQGTLEKLQRHVFGQRSERMPPINKELRDPDRAEQERIAALQKRRENLEKKRKLTTRRIEHKVPEDRQVCPKCGGREFTKLGGGVISELYDLIPSMIERQLHIQEKLRCRCGEGIITAEGPPKVYDKARFGPSFMAQVAVSKCADALPLYRQAKAYRRVGVPVDDSTLGDLFHRTAELVKPIYDRLVDVISKKEIVLADETSHRVQAPKKTRTAWLWSFIGQEQDDRELIAFVYSPNRSSETPKRILAGTVGKLLTDKYAAYDQVTLPGGRERAACFAHVRRYFFNALSTTPAAQQALDLIRELYRVERTALDHGILGTLEHLDMRQTTSREVMARLKEWLEAERDQHLPKGPMGVAIRYALEQWDELSVFLNDARVPIDNNPSENALRAVAIGRKNFLFVGNDTAGENLAGLYSLIGTCEANGINPLEYLADVLMRVQTHPASKIDELLPHNWKPPERQPSA